MTPERFWKKVRKTATCWIWTGAKHCDGYGYVVIFSDGKWRQKLAHRYSWEIAYGVVPVLQINHKRNCNNRPCVNPEHLYEGTQTQNIRDMDACGRRGVVRGSDQPNAKLRESDIKRIRKLRAQGKSQSEVGRELGISQSHVSSIELRKSWKHVREIPAIYIRTDQS